MRVLITGANGFLGRHVVAELLRRGHEVRALVRPAADLSEMEWPDQVEIVRADLRASRDLAPAFNGVEVLIHLAAAVVGDEDLQFQSTVVGTERLLEAMARSATRRLVLASSYSVYDWSEISGTLTEDAPIESNVYERDGYAIAKIWQERIVRAAAAKNGWSLTVLRPGFIWGRGNEYLAGIGQSFGPFHIVFGVGAWLPLTDIVVSLGGRMPLTHVVNCADAFVAAMESDRAAGGTYNIVDDEGVTPWEYMGEYLRRKPAGGYRVHCPYWLGMGTARLARFVSKAMFRGKGKLPSILTPCKFEARFKPLKHSNRRLREALNWSPPLTPEQRLRATYEAPAPAPIARVEPTPLRHAV